MNLASQWLLVAGIAAVGVLHTVVPDHWVPITLLARQRGWSAGETARAAFVAGTGHVASTLAIALAVWIAGAAMEARFGAVVDTAASIALIGFGGWIAIAAWHDLRRQQPLGHGHTHSHHSHGHGHSHPHGHNQHAEHEHAETPGGPLDDPLYAPLRGIAVAVRHAHLHRHGNGSPHLHWHDHPAASAHAASAALALAPPPHDHLHRTTARTALLLILGSSPMVEGIPAFFAAGRYGAWLIAVMAAVFATATIATYIALCVASAAGLQRLRLGRFERYGEVLSGGVIALIGVAFAVASAA